MRGPRLKGRTRRKARKKETRRFVPFVQSNKVRGDYHAARKARKEKRREKAPTWVLF